MMGARIQTRNKAAVTIPVHPLRREDRLVSG